MKFLPDSSYLVELVPKVLLGMAVALEEWAMTATKLKAAWDQEITERRPPVS